MNTPLQQAAQAMIDRWDSTDWKDTPHTAHYIAALRKALDAELAQSVEPVAWVSKHDVLYSFDDKCAVDPVNELSPLYLHPPQPQATTPAGEISESVIDEFLEDYEMIGESEDGLEGCYVPDEDDKALIKDAVFGLLEHVSTLATQGEQSQATTPVPEGYALVPIEPTEAMVDAYLAANTAYWLRTDELPKTDPSRWRQGTPSDATAESYRAMINAAQGEKP